MYASTLDWSARIAFTAITIPAVFMLASLVRARERTFLRARVATALSCALWLGMTLQWALCADFAPIVHSLTFPWLPPLSVSVRIDPITVLMMGLVSFLAMIISRFSDTYLQGEKGRGRYERGLLLTLGSVALLVVSNNLLVVSLAWLSTSLALHTLLTFYDDRAAALIAAHKKFLVSRAGDLCLLSTLALIAHEIGSLELDHLASYANEAAALPWTLHVAALLLVLGAALKSAQLPFHGWLIQVMEAPTPVSALLHAGVVNLGGFMMIRVAPLMEKAWPAQAMLVALGTTTALLAGFVMTTRISIKVQLAWSTCAQMGFMLVECGLGAYDLALLHLLAHSLYKAHAFLSCGSAVERHALLQHAPKAEKSTVRGALIAALVSLLIALSLAELSGFTDHADAGTWALCGVLALALAPLLAQGDARISQRLLSLTLVSATVALYLTLHAAFRGLAGTAQHDEPLLRSAFVAFAFSLGFLVQTIMQAQPKGALAKRLYPRLFGGLYLDDAFTRIAFRLWPPKLPASEAPVGTYPILEAQEA